MTYRVNEVYRSPQGEGGRAGHDSVFLRFTGCNLRCAMEPGPKSPGGFDCDTEFESGRTMTLGELVSWVREEAGEVCRWVVVTGGEPALQLDADLVTSLHDAGFLIAVETNGSKALPDGIDWITVSPKVAEHAIRQRTATEVKYVRGYGQALPETVVEAEQYYISPTFAGLEPDPRAVAWCEQLVKGTKWKLSMQQHKLLGQR
ncbi:NrdG Organic radical activating enzymes [uncultured Caudovirales phage]|uniref:NrdG Organic radical activating enzymes n=1 Tax=uncultured Caudovirales phage TaxID=2100421 RepID=A0A6J5MGH0_9CAUD|nr:NrdG Organic radical activating enzymes [uncultured Caudovirales phage]CAB4180533.1 NrdG Organic radical activating enzymes [uncultured Caudovirales phage]CAB4190727.1 NrdG Organic radical activating enzymes [uncultured Caudovirales phage]CAB4221858.1 NrdG Organic radical activating enzymes [uncultured Caudovirales phage]